jgi:hypothetical protein
MYSDLPESECLVLVEKIMEEPIPHIQKFGEDRILVLHDTSASNEILILIYFSNEKTCDVSFLKNEIIHHSQSNISTSLNYLEKKRYILRNNGKVYLTKIGEKHIIDVMKKLND